MAARMLGRRGLALRAQTAGAPLRGPRSGRTHAPYTTGAAHSFSDAQFGPAQDGDRCDPPRPPPPGDDTTPPTEHAVISMFDLFSVGIGPSSSHTVGPMRAGAIFVSDLRDAGILRAVAKIKLALYGSLAATGKGHMTPQALLLGLEGADCETVDTDSVPQRYEKIMMSKYLTLGKDTPQAGKPQRLYFDCEKDLEWKWGQKLPMHSNGMRMSVFSEEGDLLATNDFYSIGGGFVVNGMMDVAGAPDLGKTRAGDGREPTEENRLVSVDAVSAPTHHPIDALENVFYKSIRRSDADGERREGVRKVDNSAQEAGAQLPAPRESQPDCTQSPATVQSAQTEDDGTTPGGSPPKEPRFPFHNMASLLAITRQHNLTIAQVVYENELTWFTAEEIHEKIMRIWSVMDEGIRAGVHSDQKVLPGSLKMRRRAPKLYSQLTRGLYMGPRRMGNRGADGKQAGDECDDGSGAASQDLIPRSTAPARRREQSRAPRIRGAFQHDVLPVPARRPNFPAMDWLSCWAIATNEQVAAGGRIVIAPTLGAAGIIPAVLRYVVEFVALSPEDEENLVMTFLLTAAAIGMLFKRGATISAAEGGCMAEVGTSCSMAAAAFAACMGASPEVIEQAAETAIEHNLGLTCDPVDGLVQAPCIERNAVGAVKAVVSANLALSTGGDHSISLDEAIHAARITAADMHTKYKETR
ncbi:hypothetical protein MSPP1_000815 [Malassezia sp. CBS 17886]|nr:hypothetical protein MSPP1_000815 [Malassezia sp. CBS 17886]